MNILLLLLLEAVSPSILLRVVGKRGAMKSMVKLYIFFYMYKVICPFGLVGPLGPGGSGGPGGPGGPR